MTIVHATYNSHATFYRKAYNLKGYNIQSFPLEDFHRNKYEFGNGNLKLEVGDTLMLCEWQGKNQFQENYIFEVLTKSGMCDLAIVTCIRG